MNMPSLPSVFAPGDPFPNINATNWPLTKERLCARIAPFLGKPTSLDPAFKVTGITCLEEKEHPEGRLTKIAYEAEPGERVTAWLLVPHGVTGPSPTVLCLHGTTPIGKESLLWPNEAKPNRDFAAQLARLGIVTFSPDHLTAGERHVDPDRPAYNTHLFYERHPCWSEMGKMIWDVQRAIDAMAHLPVVDSNRLGAVGHSLGGYGSFIAAAFEERLKVIASSCGFTTWEKNDTRFNWTRPERYRHFPGLRPYFERDEIPFELYELAALLAPRPFLNLSGMMDPVYSLASNATLPEAGRRLADLYAKIGHPDKFANYLFGGGHDIPDDNVALIGGWFQRWL